MNAQLRIVVGLSLALAACGADASGVDVPGHPDATKTSAVDRALRRAYDGAPPVIAHQDFAADCMACHEKGMAVPDVGYAPPVPHANAREGAMSRCRQCHVFSQVDDVFRENGFVGLKQDLRKGDRLHAEAPPVIPHQVLLRENCLSCHSGPAAREAIRCPHPERVRCTQCHVPVAERSGFLRK